VLFEHERKGDGFLAVRDRGSTAYAIGARRSNVDQVITRDDALASVPAKAVHRLARARIWGYGHLGRIEPEKLSDSPASPVKVGIAVARRQSVDRDLQLAFECGCPGIPSVP
jgi:hypothetical protein